MSTIEDKKMPFAFICYDSAEEAKAAIENLNGKPLHEGKEDEELYV